MSDLTIETIRDELFIALRRLIAKADAFQQMAQNFDETDTTDHELTVALMLAHETVQLACPHGEWKGADVRDVNDPKKRWCCAWCQKLRVGPG